jgi:hypothetical protein
LIAPVLLFLEFADPLTTAGLGPRRRTLSGNGLSDELSDATLGGRLARRMGRPEPVVSFWINPPFAAPPDLDKAG